MTIQQTQQTQQMVIQPRVKVRYFDAIKYAAINMSNPVSVHGSTAIFRLALATGGPTFHKMVEEMKKHPTGSRILRDKPDLTAVFTDLKGLEKYAEGTLGNGYYKFMTHPLALPGYLLGTQHYRENYFDKATVGWSEDAKWLAERMVNHHDLFHAMAGYGATLAGEALIAMTTAGAFVGDKARKPGRIAANIMSFVPTSVGRKKWKAALIDALERGIAIANHIPFHSIYWEELLDVPIAELEQHIGLPPIMEADMFNNQEGWISGRLADSMANGWGTLSRDKVWLTKMARLVEEADLSPKLLWSLESKKREQLYCLQEKGASKKDIQQLAFSMAA